MLRLLVTAVLVPALLLTQWVSAFRCAGCPMPGRESRPHVHLSDWLPTIGDEADCPCHRHQPTAKSECHREAESADLAAFTASAEGDDFTARTDVVLMLPQNADWGLGNTGDRSPGTEDPAAVDAPVFRSRVVHPNAMPIPRQFPSATPPFPVELAALALRV